ncbi:MAG: hypothetical protein ACREMQ_02080 [Longimicrobiales bacterium]
MAWGNRPPAPDSAWAYYRYLVALDTGATVRPHDLLRVAAVLARAGRMSEADSLLAEVRREIDATGIDPHHYLPWEAGVRRPAYRLSNPTAPPQPSLSITRFGTERPGSSGTPHQSHFGSCPIRIVPVGTFE